MRNEISRKSIAVLISLLTFGNASVSFAQSPSQSFSDVPSNHPAFEAVEYLKAQGIIAGYANGTFKPNAKVNRAEAVKILIAPLVNAQQLGQFATTEYQDIPADAWYKAYVEAARQSFGIVDGPPKTVLFHGDRPVLKVEFLKMLLLANKIDVNSYSEIKLPLALDVTNPDEWFYPYMRYAISASITMISADGTLSPGREITRADVALFMHRFMMYREGRRTQALLSEAETEIHNILESLDKNDITQAEYASARALLSARGAHASKPDEAIVQGAVKTTEAFRALVRAYRAGVAGDLDTVINLASEAWSLAAKAKELDPSLAGLSDQVQQTAKNMADSARALKAQNAP